MKQSTTLHLIVIFFLTLNTLYSQTTCSSWAFNSQADIDQFFIDNPDCTEFSNEVVIGDGGPSDISDLSPFNNIKIINRNLIINGGLGQLKEINGFENLEEIGIDFIISSSLLETINLPKLKTVQRDFIIESNEELVELGPFESLITIGDNMEIIENYKLAELSHFNSLETINGQLRLYKNDLITGITGFNELNYIGNQFTIYDNSNLSDLSGFNNLERVEADFRIELNPKLGSLNFMHSLIDVGGLRIKDNENLISIEGFGKLENGGWVNFRSNESLEKIKGFEQLKEVESLSILASPLLIDYPEFESLNSIEYFLDFVGLHSITNLKGFNNITEIPIDLFISSMNLLNEISGFQKLASVGLLTVINNKSLEKIDFDSLTTITEVLNLSHNSVLSDLSGLSLVSSPINGSLTIENNSILTNLDPLSSIPEINGSFRISSNNNLLNLDAFKNIKSNKFYMSITDNPLLNDISGLSNISPEALMEENFLTYDIYIIFNQSLDVCNIKSICKYLAKGGTRILLNNNGEQCDNIDELDCRKFGIQGLVYIDRNENGFKDTNENGIPNQRIYFENLEEELVTDENGRFFQFADDGSPLKFSWSEDLDWTLSSAQEEYEFNYDSESHFNNSYNFGLKPQFSDERAQVFLTSTPTRCNTISTFTLDYKNLGTQVLTAAVSLKYDEESVFEGSEIEPDFHDEINRVLKWNMYNFIPFQSTKMKVDFLVPLGESIGEEMSFIEEAISIENDDYILDKAAYHPVVLCAYDPNDKLVNPIGILEDNLVVRNQKLKYTIRFQNIGNAEAIDIVVRDTIDENLDMRTFKLLSASHSVNTKLNDNVVEFRFDNIWLPDSLSNEPESHGYVAFEIDMLPNLEDYTPIKNNASIYFDFNPAIVTNTTLSTAVEQLPTSTKEYEKERFKIFPNPASDELIVINLTNMDVQKIEVLNSIGQLVIESNERKLDVSFLDSGVYIVNVKTLNWNGSTKLIICK